MKKRAFVENYRLSWSDPEIGGGDYDVQPTWDEVHLVMGSGRRTLCSIPTEDLTQQDMSAWEMGLANNCATCEGIAGFRESRRALSA